MGIEDESKFYVKNDIGSIIHELIKCSGEVGDWIELTDTYFRLEGFPKKSTLRVRDNGMN